MPDYIEGKRAVMEAIRCEVPLRVILLADNVKNDKLLSDITRKAGRLGIQTKKVKRQRLDELSERGSHQGIMAEAKPFNYVSGQNIIDAAVSRARETESSLIIVLDHITDAGNLGAIVRSAEIVGASGVVIPNKRSAHVTAATYKSSAGAVAHIPVAQVGNLAQFLDRTKEEGFWVAGASEQADQCIWDAPLSGKMILVMGNEGNGLARLTQEKCDFLVALPQAGDIGSLNVAQAATACMYEWMRQNRESVS